ncbi:CRISPR-associated endonuclease Cas2 [Vibrio parahaemolyticus]|nr:CRISPR-associated endonuclease Cas2 [Vibrio parahaemolyticus]EJL6404732.1 CRISPR-associated endonuclease Cas2 [Vibrio parahaemolyticus]
MTTFFISYDLVANRDYKRLYTELEGFGAVRVLESVWCLKHSNTTASDLRDHLRGFIDRDDRLLVIQSADWASLRLLKSPNDI